MSEEPTTLSGWEQWYRHENHPGMWPQANSVLRHEFNGRPPGQALDLGSGDGRNTLWLASRGWTVTAIDYSLAATSIAKERATAKGLNEKISWQTIDILTYHPTPASIDLLLIANLSLSRAHLQVLLTQLTVGLKQNSHLLMINTEKPDPSHTSSPDEATFIRQAGLKIETTYQISRPLPGSIYPALDHVIMARRQQDTDQH